VTIRLHDCAALVGCASVVYRIVLEDLMTVPYDVKRFCDAQGRVRQWPARLRDQRSVAHYLADKFAVDYPYAEKEVNALMEQWHTFGDYTFVRRVLIDFGLLKRMPDGSVYWRGTIDDWLDMVR
jgi:hypothetical protein